MVTEIQSGRMLLSHNFDMPPERVLPLSRAEFADVFRASLRTHPLLHCRLVDLPHWIVEILFPTAEFTPAQVGELCAQALIEKRRSQAISRDALPEILVLGGLKTTTPTNDSADALQPGNWGVDVVETASGAAFLQAIGWETTIAAKPPETIFKVERRHENSR